MIKNTRCVLEDECAFQKWSPERHSAGAIFSLSSPTRHSLEHRHQAGRVTRCELGGRRVHEHTRVDPYARYEWSDRDLRSPTRLARARQERWRALCVPREWQCMCRSANSKLVSSCHRRLQGAPWPTKTVSIDGRCVNCGRIQATRGHASRCLWCCSFAKHYASIAIAFSLSIVGLMFCVIFQTRMKIESTCRTRFGW